MIIVNGDLDLHFQGQLVGNFVAGTYAIIVVEIWLKLVQR